MRDYKMINNPERSKWLENLQQTVGLRSNDIAAAVAYTISTPETVPLLSTQRNRRTNFDQ
ncbi:MAG: hypothetical protein IJJ10_16475 [Bacillus sp. (in: Bacteria)]|uniref:hypothetical protein n=1 Tax=Niallia TaxID=2837506 RepID=UPI000332942E|nr:hypothetical protein A499_24097 [Niallia nealsonii AAU1]MBQ6449028.1 hypothetical protein [Bacillus sp. (in: firmicutes)]MDU1846846.1 hypothetical protein [Niallia nealsonii]